MNVVDVLHRGALNNDVSLVDGALRSLYEGGAQKVRDALAFEIDGMCAVEAALRGGAADIAVKLMHMEREAADEIVHRLEMLEAKAVACDREALRIVECRAIERARDDVQRITLLNELRLVEEQICSLDQRLSPPMVQLSPDVIQLIAYACCPGVEALAWCAVSRDHHASRPPLRLLILDDYADARRGGAFAAGPVRIAMQCGGGSAFPAGACGPRIEPIAQLPFLPTDALGGLHIHLRPASRPYPAHVHLLLSRVSAVHAGELTHLSLQMFHDIGLYNWAEANTSGQHAVLPTGEAHGGRLTSLRVLEVLHVAELAKVHCSIKDADMSFAATRALVQAVAPTLRTLSLVHTTGNAGAAREMKNILRAVGPHLSYLSLFLVECRAILAVDGVGRGAENRCVLDVPWREAEASWEAAHWQDDQDDDFESPEDEIETELLVNAAEGLCIALHEPARVLAHVPLATDGQRMPVVGACGAALASPEWLLLG